MKRIRDFKQRIGNIAGKDLINNLDDVLQVGTNYRFLTGVVTETISNPYEYLNRNFRIGNTEYNETTIGDVLSDRVRELFDGTRVTSPIRNAYHVQNMPMNSAIVQIVDNSRTKSGEKMIIAYPFFPPHLSLPLKTGEYVWIVQEDIKGVDFFYWMCRKVGAMQVDDVNFTNLERTSLIAEMYSQHYDSGRNFVPAEDTLQKMTSLGKSDSSNLATETYADILKSSYGYVNEFIGEAVPRTQKNCGDLLIQGSNNARIQLGTDKFENEVLSVDPSGAPNSEKLGTGTIDISVGRFGGVYDEQVTSNKSDGDPQLEYLEQDKLKDIKYNPDKSESLLADELKDNKPLAVMARLYISSLCDFDVNFGSGSMFAENMADYAGSCIVSYAEHNRIASISTTRIINSSGQSFLEMDEEGNIQINALKASTANVKVQCGSQRLYLSNDMESLSSNAGLSELHAKNKIKLRVNEGNANEGYVLHSELKSVLNRIFAILQFYKITFEQLAPLRLPPFIGPANAIIQTLITNGAGFQLENPATDASTNPKGLAASINTKLDSKKIFGH